jgi:hypothetical protein
MNIWKAQNQQRETKTNQRKQTKTKKERKGAKNTR